MVIMMHLGAHDFNGPGNYAVVGKTNQVNFFTFLVLTANNQSGRYSHRTGEDGE
jgi:hypothetical protein